MVQLRLLLLETFRLFQSTEQKNQGRLFDSALSKLTSISISTLEYFNNPLAIVSFVTFQPVSGQNSIPSSTDDNQLTSS